MQEERTNNTACLVADVVEGFLTGLQIDIGA